MRKKTAETADHPIHGSAGRQNIRRRLSIVPPAVVGIVDSKAAIRAARRLSGNEVDFLEWRADCLGTRMVEAPFPWIATARHPAEGGKNALSAAERRRALREMLPRAGVVDVELRSMREMASVVSEARQAGVLVLASFHDFDETPSTSRLKSLVARALDSGADCLKIATHTQHPGDVARLLDFLSSASLPVAAMGMGSLGMASRVVLAASGSVLNYGWLHRPNVDGQWPARELRRILHACGAREPVDKSKRSS